ncbi:hypothetical protein ADIS_4127 [Lunatimonas lonarensis]|uniref:SusE outer membrane protein domain-containing protein n=1 Tax=Lunatimonas lonarensis TaxID=1232681 RepID=R7ZMW1_9BACT|nr:SusE domain-containing protein [Lunatimonas lonarensis]EON75423.1 hypothetical protein ADIS_4127 [Lunatimonas lonarensis]
MKYQFHNFLSLLLLLGLLASCAEEELVMLSAEAAPPTILNPVAGSTIALQQEAESERIAFEFTPADFGFQAAVTYVLQADIAGNNFTEAVDMGSGTASPIELTVREFNQRLIQRGLTPEQAEEMEFRVVASINPLVEARASEAVLLEVVAFAVQLQFPRLYLPGDHQGWDPANEQTVIYSVNSDGIFEGYVHILTGNGQFKINETPSWDVNFGDNEGNGSLDAGGENLSVAGRLGTFLLSVNMNELTYEIGPNRVWGLVGDATPGGWDTDTPLAFDAAQNILTLTLDLNAGNLKFRANNSWDFNFGDNGLNGQLDSGGADIPVEEAGNYTVTMDWRTPGEVTYTLKKNP